MVVSSIIHQSHRVVDTFAISFKVRTKKLSSHISLVCNQGQAPDVANQFSHFRISHLSEQFFKALQCAFPLLLYFPSLAVTHKSLVTLLFWLYTPLLKFQLQEVEGQRFIICIRKRFL